MSFSRKFGLLVALQVLLVLALVGWKQWTVWTGQTIWLRSAPMDPRDLFRGEYVALEHDISRLDEGVFYRSGESGISSESWVKRLRVGDVVYVSLQRDGGYWVVDGVSEERPSDAVVFLRGRVRDVRPRREQPDFVPWSARVEYGIESWFLPRGRGPELERAARDKGKMLAVQVRVDSNGRGVLRSVRVARRDRPMAQPASSAPVVSSPVGNGVGSEERGDARGGKSAGNAGGAGAVKDTTQRRVGEPVVDVRSDGGAGPVRDPRR